MQLLLIRYLILIFIFSLCLFLLTNNNHFLTFYFKGGSFKNGLTILVFPVALDIILKKQFYTSFKLICLLYISF